MEKLEEAAEEDKQVETQQEEAVGPQNGGELALSEVPDVRAYVENKDKPERERLPFLKGHNQFKVSLWSVLKESIGKEIWKITVPVFFNEPLSILQKCASCTEFLDLLDLALAESDEMRRFALTTVHQMVQYGTIEKGGLAKPFNPLLGETFEMVVPGKFQFLGEQVSHHPPISAFHIEGKSGYLKYSTFNTKTSFGIGSLAFTNTYNEHIDLMPFGEVFEWSPPSLSFHGLIMGSPYMEIEGTAHLRDVKKPLEKYA